MMQMSDESGTFKIYMTYDSVVPVTNSTSLAILDVLKSDDKTLSDISCELSISASTVFFNLKSLIEDKLVMWHFDEVNKKKIIYSLISIDIIGSVPYDKDLDALIEETCTRMFTEADYFYRGYHILDALLEQKMGLCLASSWNIAGKDVARGRFSTIKSDKIEELFIQISEFAEAADIPKLSVFSFVPLIITLRTKMAIPPNLPNIFSSYLGFIESTLEKNLGVNYTKSSVESAGNDRMNLKIQFDRRSSASNYDQFIENYKGDMTPAEFMIVKSENGSDILTNSVQIGLMRELSKGDCTLTSLSKEFSIPKSTMFTNLAKMAERGLISQCMDPETNLKTYSSKSQILIVSKPPVNISEDVFDSLQDEIFKNPKSYFGNMLIYLHLRFEMMGIDISPMATLIGRYLAETLASRHSDKDANEFLDLLCNTKMPFDSSIEVISYLPLTLRVKFKLDTLKFLSNSTKCTYNGFFDTLFSGLLGTKCLLSSEQIDSTDVDLLYCIHPTSSAPSSPGRR